MSRGRRRRGRASFALTAAAFCWALAIVAGAFVVPVYSGVSESSDGSTTIRRTFSSTLVDENGLAVLIPLAVPVAMVVLVWFALHRRCSRGRVWAGSVAWAAIWMLGVFSFLTSASVGAILIPIVLMLVVAALLAPLPAGR
jgi:hypothetical protein